MRWRRFLPVRAGRVGQVRQEGRDGQVAMKKLLVVGFVLVAGALLRAQDGRFDQAAVDRGKELLVGQCGFCHGSNARGGSSGPDLTRSELVQSDEGGK